MMRVRQFLCCIKLEIFAIGWAWLEMVVIVLLLAWTLYNTFQEDRGYVGEIALIRLTS